MATKNGLFNIKLEKTPFTSTQNFTGATAGNFMYTTASWDVAVHEVTWSVNPTFIENADELRGYTSMPWHDGAGSMAAEITAKARVRPKMLALLLYMATGGTITKKTGTQSDHGGNVLSASAYECGFSWSTADVPVTATIYFSPTKGDGFKLSGAGLSTMAFSFEESGALVADMTFRGLYFIKDTATTITPSYETAVPMKKSNFTFTGGSSIFSDATNSKATDINWSIENNIQNFFSFGANSSWPDAIEYEDLWARVSGSITKRQVLAADYDRWVGKGVDTHFDQCIQGVGDFLSGTTGPKFSMYTHLPAVQWLAMNPEAITNKRRIGVTFDWEARTDANGTGNWCDFYCTTSQDPVAFTTFS